ncbi:hypothetical protein EDB84DRAFT_160194 [Lactarius hengduanensis]|nr:hypothetical protein EDB84DRAFT_160194 [Lactarius hengduanensis]
MLALRSVVSNQPKMPSARPNTSAIFETSPTQCLFSRAIKSRRPSWVRWQIRWCRGPAKYCSASKRWQSLCHEILTVVSSKIRPWVPDQPLSQVFECLRLAREHKPDLRRARDALVSSLACRYLITSVNDDRLRPFWIEVITSSSAGDSQDESVASVQRPVTMLATATVDRARYSDSEAFILRAVAVLRAVAHEMSLLQT